MAAPSGSLRYVATLGDAAHQLQQIALTGLSDTWTDGGRLHVSLSYSAPTWTVGFYRASGLGASDLACSGTGTISSTVTLSQGNSSGVSGTCYIGSGTTTDTTLIAYCYLGKDTDLYLREPGLASWFPDTDGSRTLDTDMVELKLAIFRELIERLYDEHPPEVSRAPVVTASALGQYGPWWEDALGGWMLVGLQNVDAYRDWALYRLLEMLFESRIGSQGDFAHVRAERYHDKAERLWRSRVPQVDYDHDFSQDYSLMGWEIGRG